MHAGDTSKYWNRPAVALCQYKDIVYSVNVHAMRNRCCMHGCSTSSLCAVQLCIPDPCSLILGPSMSENM
jgi:hypothetical protein